MDFSKVESAIGYVFNDKRLLRQALTLASADNDFNNQTLEFFGDAILEFIVSERIYDDEKSEGDLTERRKLLVSDSALAPVSKKLGLDGFLIKASGDTNNKKAVPSAYEAMTAAVYLDGGMEKAKKFVYSTLDFSSEIKVENFKGELQEYLQSRGESCPKYVTRDKGTPQKPHFEAKLSLFGKTYSGVAPNKQQAEQNAAKAALKKLRK